MKTRALHSIVRRVLACRPETADPAECGLGGGPAVLEAFRVCRLLFWTGVESVRADSDERTLPEILDSVSRYLGSEGAVRAELHSTHAELVDQEGITVKSIAISDVGMPDYPGGEAPGGEILNRTLGKGWRRRLWTWALLYRSMLIGRRAAEEEMLYRKTALAIAGLRDIIPQDVVIDIVRMIRREGSRQPI